MHKISTDLLHKHFSSMQSTAFYGCNPICGISITGSNYLLWLGDNRRVEVKPCHQVLVDDNG